MNPQTKRMIEYLRTDIGESLVVHARIKAEHRTNNAYHKMQDRQAAFALSLAASVAKEVQEFSQSTLDAVDWLSVVPEVYPLRGVTHA